MYGIPFTLMLFRPIQILLLKVYERKRNLTPKYTKIKIPNTSPTGIFTENKITKIMFINY